MAEGIIGGKPRKQLSDAEKIVELRTIASIMQGENIKLRAEVEKLNIHNVMPSGFTLQQENAIWGVIQHLAREQHKDPKKIWKRADVFKMIKDELDW